MWVSNRYHAGLHDTYSTHLPQALSENCPVVPVRGTAKPLDRTDVPKPLPCALQPGNRLLHPLIANWNLPSLGCLRQVLTIGGHVAGHEFGREKCRGRVSK